MKAVSWWSSEERKYIFIQNYCRLRVLPWSQIRTMLILPFIPINIALLQYSCSPCTRKKQRKKNKLIWMTISFICLFMWNRKFIFFYFAKCDLLFFASSWEWYNLKYMGVLWQLDTSIDRLIVRLYIFGWI